MLTMETPPQLVTSKRGHCSSCDAQLLISTRQQAPCDGSQGTDMRLQGNGLIRGGSDTVHVCWLCKGGRVSRFAGKCSCFLKGNFHTREQVIRDMPIYNDMLECDRVTFCHSSHGIIEM